MWLDVVYHKGNYSWKKSFYTKLSKIVNKNNCSGLIHIRRQIITRWHMTSWKATFIASSTASWQNATIFSAEKRCLPFSPWRRTTSFPGLSSHPPAPKRKGKDVWSDWWMDLAREAALCGRVQATAKNLTHHTRKVIELPAAVFLSLLEADRNLTSSSKHRGAFAAGIMNPPKHFFFMRCVFCVEDR